MAGTLYNLLKVYPQFDETPHVKMPEKYVVGPMMTGSTAKVIVRSILMCIK